LEVSEGEKTTSLLYRGVLITTVKKCYSPGPRTWGVGKSEMQFDKNSKLSTPQPKVNFEIFFAFFDEKKSKFDEKKVVNDFKREWK